MPVPALSVKNSPAILPYALRVAEIGDLACHGARNVDLGGDWIFRDAHADEASVARPPCQPPEFARASEARRVQTVALGFTFERGNRGRGERRVARPIDSAQKHRQNAGRERAPMTTTEPRLWRALAESDPEIATAIRSELNRQNTGLELIASENFVSRAVLESAGSILTNKYAEGYPGRRYYGGCEFVDVVERAAIARAKALFGADHANVQPHSGAQANMAVFLSVLKPGDTILGMNLAHGGHLTHGHPLNFSGKLYNIVPYGVSQADERIDYDELDRLADEHRPKMIVVGASAYPRIIDFPRVRRAADRVGALVFTDMAHIAGLVAAGVHPSPVPHADFVSSTTHKTLRGPRGGLVLCREQYAKDLDRAVFPGVQGGPLMHAIAGKAVCFKEASEPEFAAYQRQIAANAQRLAAASRAAGFRLVSGGTDNHPCWWTSSPRASPASSRSPRSARPDHGQQERDPLRQKSADGRERHSHRHPRRHDTRLARTRDGPGRRVRGSRAQDAGGRARPRHGARGSRSVLPEIPALSGIARA